MEININCDLGETSKFCSTENDPKLLEIINSANIACGYHAGDKATMRKTIQIAKKNGVSIVQDNALGNGLCNVQSNGQSNDLFTIQRNGPSNAQSKQGGFGEGEGGWRRS